MKNLFNCLLVFIVLFLGCSSDPQSPTPMDPVDNGKTYKVSFVGRDNSPAGVILPYLGDITLLEHQLFTDELPWASTMSPSPDGNRVAFVSSETLGSVFQIYLSDASGTNILALPDSEYPSRHYWSPNSQELLVGFGNSLKLFNAATLDSRTLEKAGFELMGFTPMAWGPESDKIYLRARPDSNFFEINIFELDLNTAAFIQLTRIADSNVGEFCISADGKFLFYVTFEISGGIDKYTLIKKDILLGNVDTLLTASDERVVRKPLVSPDNQHIAFQYTASINPGKLELYLMNLDGSDLSRFTFLQKHAFDHAWRPDSKGLAFFGQKPGEEPDVFYQALTENEAVRVSSNMEQLRTLGWMPFKTAPFDSSE
ncbi:MAG: hypothetical protein ACRBF0_09965 [Calditrichia bacterium]